ncbi:hypothetical protein cypCar_00005695 [Cyprinus carpio]|nr:hypothetical protein cypCar_00005695 [Cyprinus carpio]
MFLLFFSDSVPFGTPVVVGLLLPNQTFASTIFWQWQSQSNNACVNYCNRNATQMWYISIVILTGTYGDGMAYFMFTYNPTPMSKFFQGYLGAVSSAVTIALSLHLASANVCNVLLMCHTELSEGISVLDDKGNVVGTSNIAARHVSSDGDIPDTCRAAHACSLAAIFNNGYAGEIHVSELEPEIAAATECKILTYNKGL